jgi:hypothetical protein
MRKLAFAFQPAVDKPVAANSTLCKRFFVWNLEVCLSLYFKRYQNARLKFKAKFILL